MTDTKAIIVPPKGAVRHVNIDFTGVPTEDLESLQGCVGGFIEILNVGDFHLVVNKDGKDAGLPINKRASAAARAALLPNDDLVGSVLFVGRDQAGAWADLPRDVELAILAISG